MALSKTGRFLSKAEILGVGGSFPPFKLPIPILGAQHNFGKKYPAHNSGYLGSSEQKDVCQDFRLEFFPRSPMFTTKSCYVPTQIAEHPGPSLSKTTEIGAVRRVSVQLGCRKWGCNKWGLIRGVWPPFLEIGRNRPKSPFFCLFRPFPEGAKSTWEIQKTEEKRPFSSDILGISLNPHLLNPHLRHSNPGHGPSVGVGDIPASGSLTFQKNIPAQKIQGQ